MKPRKPLQSLLSVLKPPSALSGSEWANTYLSLSPEDSAERGRYNTGRAPYQKEILNECTNRRNRTVVVMSSAQIGKTLMIKAVVGYRVHQEPVPMLLIQPTLDMAEAFSKDRLSSMIRDTPVLKGLIDDSKSRSSGNTILHKKFRGGHITMAGANSPASLASRPVGLVLFDEPDRYPDSAGTEGDPCELGERRTDGFYGAQSIYFSTPTHEGASRIAAKYELTDQRKFFVPCPLCEHMQILEWEGLRWDTDAKSRVTNARYICESCGEAIPESKKSRMLSRGEWRATATAFRPGFVGFWINALYSPFKPWTDRIYTYLESKGTPEKYQVFWNTILGRLWKQAGDAPDWEKVWGRRERYEFNRVPKSASIILAGADVQADRIEVEIRAYGPRLESWGIDYRKIVGPTSQPEVWRKLDELMQENFPYTDGGAAPIYRLAIDSGYETVQVYNFARRWGAERVMVVKGSSTRLAPMLRGPSLQDKDSRGNKLPGGVYLWIVGTDVIKNEIYRAIRQKPGVAGEEVPFGQMHFPDHDEGYFKQLVSEGLVVKRLKSGAKRYYWELPPGARNETLDCNVYTRACAAAVGVDRWTPELHRKYLDARVHAQAKAAETPAHKRRKSATGRKKSRLFD